MTSCTCTTTTTTATTPTQKRSRGVVQRRKRSSFSSTTRTSWLTYCAAVVTFITVANQHNWCWWHAEAFVAPSPSLLPPPPGQSSSATTKTTTTTTRNGGTTLFGVRAVLRKGFRKIIPKSQKPQKNVSPKNAEALVSAVETTSWDSMMSDAVTVVTEECWTDKMTTISTTSSSSSFSSFSEQQQQVVVAGPEEKVSSTITTTTTTTARPPIQQKRRHDNVDDDAPLYVLPPPATTGSGTSNAKQEINDEDMISRREKEFRDMLTYLNHNYVRRDIFTLRDPRMRIILQGVAASAEDEHIYRAFAILFEDLAPMRWAGRTVFTRCTALLDEGLANRDAQIHRIVQTTTTTTTTTTGWDARVIDNLRIRFGRVVTAIAMDPHCHQEHYQAEVMEYLTPEQLMSIDHFSVICQNLNRIASPSDLVRRLDRQGTREIDWQDLLMGLHECLKEEGNESAGALDLVHELLDELEVMENCPTVVPTTNAKLAASHAKERRNVERFNEMVEIFRGWKDQVPWLWEKEGRKWQVVQGCFWGAENEKVVDALRVVYVEYTALRVAAEAILALAASLLQLKPRVQR